MVTIRLNYILIALLLLGLTACGGRRAPSGVLAPPTEVEAVKTADGMMVTWRDNSSEEAGFRIYRYQGLEPLSVEEAETESEVEANETSFPDTEIDLSKDYTYRVQAFNDTGVSSAVGVGEEPNDAPPPEGQARIIVERAGGGKGQVISDPGGIACDHVSGDNCSATFNFGTEVTLQPQPDDNSVFEGWEGQCSGAETCTITVSPDLADTTGNIRVSANIRQLSATLSVSKTGSGSGTVVDKNSGGDIIDCGDTCEVSYSTQSPVIVVLEAVAAEGLSFGGWRGEPCDGQTGDCRVTIDRDITLEALFGQPAPTITSFVAAPQSVQEGQEATLSWQLGGAASAVKLSAVVNGETTQIDVPEGATSLTVRPAVSTTYTLVAVGEGGESAPQEVTVTVNDAPSITSFAAEDDTVLARTETILNWNIAGEGVTGISLLANGKRVNRDIAPTARSIVVRPSRTTVYTLLVETTFGTLEANTTVSVGKAPEIKSFKPEKSPIGPGKRATLTWKVEDASELSINNGIGLVTGQESVLSDVINDTTEFELIALNDFGASRETTTVEVDIDELPKPKITAFGVRDNKLQVREGEAIVLEWEIENQEELSDLIIEFNDDSSQLSNPRTRQELETNVIGTTNYTLSAIAPGGRDASETITVEVIPTAAIGTFSAPDAVRVGERFDVTWTGVTGTSARFFQGALPIPVTSLDFPDGGRPFIAPILLDEVTYTLVVTDDFGEEVRAEETVQILPALVEPEPPVIASFEADTDLIERGEQVTLSWDIPNQETLTRLVVLREPGETLESENPTADTALRARPAQTTTYTLELENEDGIVRSEPITITVENSDPNVVPDDTGFETF